VQVVAGSVANEAQVDASFSDFMTVQMK